MGRPKKPIYGVGINDAPYNTQPVVNGKKIWCKFARTWKDMLERCYSEKFHKKYPSYVGTTVCEEWHSFMNFRKWMVEQDHAGRQLDKDILGTGKHYSPETCRFITQQTNSVLTGVKKEGLLPLGVSKIGDGRYKANMRLKGKLLHLGVKSSPREAHELWQAAKAHSIQTRIDSGEECAEIVAALQERVDQLRKDILNKKETFSL